MGLSTWFGQSTLGDYEAWQIKLFERKAHDVGADLLLSLPRVPP